MSSRKVLIVTIQDNTSFGNRLQNFALQQALEQLGLEVSTLDVKERKQKNFVNDLKTSVKISLARMGHTRFNEYLERHMHEQGGRAFTREYIHNMIRASRSDLKDMDWSGYSCVFAGSDQVWHNWGLIPDELEYFYLDFIPSSKRASYAASFGFTSFPQEDLGLHRKGLTQMHAISCRESEGCVLVEMITGKNPVKVLDPTLLLSSATWDGIMTKPSFEVEGKYLLAFFLGDILEGYNEEITRIANERGLKVININDINEKEHFVSSPSEFLWLIKNADTVCTDSFHASVFTILYNRCLRVYPRTDLKYNVEGMFGRLTEVLGSFGLMENAFGYGDRIDTDVAEEDMKLLEEQKRISIDYLKAQAQSDG